MWYLCKSRESVKAHLVRPARSIHSPMRYRAWTLPVSPAAAAPDRTWLFRGRTCARYFDKKNKKAPKIILRDGKQSVRNSWKPRTERRDYKPTSIFPGINPACLFNLSEISGRCVSGQRSPSPDWCFDAFYRINMSKSVSIDRIFIRFIATNAKKSGKDVFWIKLSDAY